MTIDVIIPVFNRPEYTGVLLDRIYKTQNGTTICPIIVDNGSRKKTKQIIEEWVVAYDGLEIKPCEKPKIITLTENKGFAGAVNAGVTVSTAEYIAILHNDCFPFSNCFGEMVACFKQDEEVAVIIPRTCYANEMTPCILELRQQFEAIKPSNKDRLTEADVRHILERIFPNGEEKFLEDFRSKVQMDTTYSPEISSFCMLVRAETFKKYGNFDEGFWPRGFEDKFWFRSLERDGFTCMIANRAFAMHFGNITSDGAGFCFSDLMQINEKKFKNKCLEMDITHGKTEEKQN